MDAGEVSRRLTEAVRVADQHFESVGGSSRHYVVDCLGPALIDAGLAVVESNAPCGGGCVTAYRAGLAESRARAIRAVVASQWVIACCFLRPTGSEAEDFPFALPETTFPGAFFDLCAVAIVDGAALGGA